VNSAANQGESYYKSGSEWLDLYDYDFSNPSWDQTANFCIKGLCDGWIPTEPDLAGDEELSWTNVQPDSTLNDEVTIRNIGGSYSRLDWEVSEWPEWGTWTFNPSEGYNLIPENGDFNIQLEIEVPDNENEIYSGEIKIINKENEDDILTIVVSLSTMKPDIPTIDGQTNGKAGIEYEYTIKSTDPEGDDLYYYISWDDGNIDDWIGPYNSGEEVVVSHTWSEKGTYTLRVKAKDEYNMQSDWGMLEVSMPRTKMLFNSRIIDIFNQLGALFPLFKILIHWIS
jgi:hypothetical protein